MTTKRGSRQGSCRPRVAISVGSPERVTVFWARGKLLVGLTATRQTIGSPLEIPPSMPPCRFVSVPIRRCRPSPVGGQGDKEGGRQGERLSPSPPLLVSLSSAVRGMNASLFSLPRAPATANPAPYSKPITAGSKSSALARSALSL